MAPYGNCLLQNVGERLRVLEADPRVWISTDLIGDARLGRLHPDVSLDGDVLVINGIDRRVIYRIRWDEISPDERAVLGEWPD